MVSPSFFKKVFPSQTYSPSKFDDQVEPKVLPLDKQGVVDSLDRMAKKQMSDYLPGIDRLLEIEVKVPSQVPDYQNQPSGWSKLETLEPVSTPPGHVLVLDVETLVQKDSVPVMAVALGGDGLYIWKTPDIQSLIPIGTNKLVIGHNVSYDMARCAESYQGLDTKLHCLDTMTLSTLVNGFCSAQTWAEYKKIMGESVPIWAYKGFGKSNYKSLKDAFKFYCPKSKMAAPDKSLRDIFVEAESISELIPDWSRLLLYNVLDVIYTLQVFQKVYPEWRKKAPHDTSLFGQMCSSFYRLPLNPHYKEWVESTDEKYNQTVDQITSQLEEIALDKVQEYTDVALVKLSTANEFNCLRQRLIYYNIILAQLKLGPDIADPWMTQLDWTIKARTRTLQGYPEWYRKAKSGPNSTITLKSQLAPYLLSITYEGQPVVHTKEGGWHTREQDIPHPNGVGNVGYLFSKDFLVMYDNGMLKSEDERCQKLLNLAISISYWTSVRSRVKEATIHNNWTVPGVGGGTVTGRVTDPLWLTTCDPKPHLLGSELKSRIKAPPGYKLMLADFSSQEMRIAWTLGDSKQGTVGGNSMSLSGISGSKSQGTDAHSLTATKISELTGQKFSRQGAKVINFSMLYMAGVTTVSRYIRQVLPEVTVDAAKSIAKGILEYKRGKITYQSNNRLYEGGTDSLAYSAIDEIACRLKPRTPLLKREMPEPLCPQYCGTDYYTTRANYVIQATGRDLLDCLNAAFGFMAQYAGLKSQIVWSRHDEVVLLVPENEVTIAAEILQQAHMYTWAALHDELKLYDFPTHGLLFDEINVDKVCRKEVDTKIFTPSIDDNEEIGYYINIEDIKGFNTWVELKEKFHGPKT